MTDKLSIINGELAVTGNNLVAVSDDGSDEWISASAAYDNAWASTIEKHSWGFETNVTTLQRVGASPDDLYTDAFAKPGGCLHLIWIRLRDQTIDYKIINDQVCLNAFGQTTLVTAKYVVDNPAANWPNAFLDIIRLLVRAGIYRGVNEDPAEADKQEAKAEIVLQQARTRVDQEGPKRALFNSRALIARRVRRPWINAPADWGGTGVPN